jgi:hypothetical protein
MTSSTWCAAVDVKFSEFYVPTPTSEGRAVFLRGRLFRVQENDKKPHNGPFAIDVVGFVGMPARSDAQ